MNPHIEEVIITEAQRGSGTEKDAVRTIRQIWDKEGRLIGEFDHLAPVYLPSKTVCFDINQTTTDCEHGCWEINPDSSVVFGEKGGEGDKSLDIERERLKMRLDPIVPYPPSIMPWKAHETKENIIIGTWAEDCTEYEIKVPPQLRDSIIAMQHAMSELLKREE